MIQALEDNNTQYHTYKPKQGKSCRVVMKCLHPSTDLNVVKEALASIKHEVTSIWNIKPVFYQTNTLQRRFVFENGNRGKFFVLEIKWKLNQATESKLQQIKE